MMKLLKHITLIVLCGLASFGFSQTFKQRVSIQENKFVYKNKPYFFAEVVDARIFQDNLGIIYKDSRQVKYAAVLKHPLDVEVRQFLKHIYPYSGGQALIVLVIHEFEIGQTMSKTDTGWVKVNFDFYKFRGDSAAFLYNYTKQISEPAPGYSFHHENRMKRAILYAVRDIETTLQNNNSPYLPIRSLGIEQDLSKKMKPGESEAETLEDSLAKMNYSERTMTLIGLTGGLFNDAYSLGFNSSQLFRVKNHPRTLIGFSFSAYTFELYDNTPTSRWVGVGFDVGFKLLRQLKGLLYYNSNTHITLGIEDNASYSPIPNSSSYVLDNVNSSGLSVIQFANGLYLIPPRKTGPYLGVDLVFGFTSTNAFDSSVGIRFSSGIKF